jgi:hypothetical protein
MSPRPLLQLEAAAVCVASLIAYRQLHGSWLLFALLFLTPDVSMTGYLAGVRAGAMAYNAIHTYLGPLGLAGYSVLRGHRTLLLLALIWIAHIALDRALGYGLKYPTRFKDTHLGAERHAVKTAAAAT